MFILSLIGKLPLTVRSFIGAFLGAIVSMFPSRERTVAKLQLQATIPHRTSVFKVYANLGRTFFESVNLHPILEDPDAFITGPSDEELFGIFHPQRSVIALTGHVSNWDLLAAYMVKRGVSLFTIGRRARNSYFDSMLTALRESYGVKTIWRNDTDSPKDILKALRSPKTALAALIDQDTAVPSITSSFFDRPAMTPHGIVELGVRSKAKIVTCFLVRERPLRYRVILKEFPDNLTVQQILDEYHIRLEKVLREYPEQWVWIHKRWRTQSNERKLTSSEYIEVLSQWASSTGSSLSR